MVLPLYAHTPSPFESTNNSVLSLKEVILQPLGEGGDVARSFRFFAARSGRPVRGPGLILYGTTGR